MIDCRPQRARLEEVDTVQVGDVHSSVWMKEKTLIYHSSWTQRSFHSLVKYIEVTMSVPLVGLRAVGPVFLNVHPKEADFCSVDVLEGKKGFCPVRERL